MQASQDTMANPQTEACKGCIRQTDRTSVCYRCSRANQDYYQPAKDPLPRLLLHVDGLSTVYHQQEDDIHGIKESIRAIWARIERLEYLLNMECDEAKRVADRP